MRLEVVVSTVVEKATALRRFVVVLTSPFLEVLEAAVVLTSVVPSRTSEEAPVGVFVPVSLCDPLQGRWAEPGADDDGVVAPDATVRALAPQEQIVDRSVCTPFSTPDPDPTLTRWSLNVVEEAEAEVPEHPQAAKAAGGKTGGGRPWAGGPEAGGAEKTPRGRVGSMRRQPDTA